MKNIFVRFIEWLQSLLQKTEFDNKLFSQGVDKVRECIMKRLYADKVIYMTLERLFQVLTEELYDEFGHIKVVRNHLDNILEWVHEKVLSSSVFSKKDMEGQVDMICSKLKAWYNKRF